MEYGENPWSDAQWEIIQECQSIPHAQIWSNHAYRFVPALCKNCRRKVDALDTPPWGMK